MARITEKKRIKIVHCVNENPFYMSWQNHLGGFEFWMFDFYQSQGGETSIGEEFEFNYNEIQITDVILKPLTASAVRTFTLFSDNIEIENLEGFMSLRESISAWYLKDLDNNIWQQLKIEKGSYTIIEKNNAETFDFAINVTLQPRFIQMN